MEQLLNGNINLYDTQIRDVFDLSITFIFFKDTNSKIFWVNQAFADVYGKKKYEVYQLYNNSIDLSDEIFNKYILDDIEVFNTGKPKYNIEEKLYGTKKEIWVNTSKIPVFGNNGKVEGLIGFSFDITNIRKTKLEFETIINSIPETIMIFDYDGICQTIYPGKNNTWAHSTDIIGKSITEMNDSCFPDVYKKFIEGLEKLKIDKTKNQNFEYSIKIKDTEYYYDAVMTTYNGSKIMLIIRDITDKKKLDVFESFNKSIKELMIYNQKILTTLGHEDKNGK